MVGSVFILKNSNNMEEAQAFTEELMSSSLRHHESLYGVITQLKNNGKSIGLYCKFDNSENVTRRITGGPALNYYENYIYFSLIQNKIETLSKLNKRIIDLMKCVSGIEPFGGASLSRDKKAIYGITKLDTLEVIEIIMKNGENDIKRCLNSTENIEIKEVSNINPNKQIIDSYKADSWIRYGAKSLQYKYDVNKKGFNVEISASVYENYIKEIQITGNFYASPPMEPINALISLQGTPINEVYFYGVKGRLKKIEFEGIDKEAISSALDGIY
ncbi:MAG: hypothetical protein RAK17_06710, partial [Caldisphaera sp.]|nr:hypothetical protein [Caldisphaera sp.]